ncbi:MAG TPA: DUF2079 domain-containing protein [Solirubrobacteraceae bacterium]|nr:DUF2079 domain-containing protein [Solirubrobacteraceae bacterium]
MRVRAAAAPAAREGAGRGGDGARRDPVVVAAALAAVAAYSLLAVVRHRTFRSTGFDLGLFDQVVWHYSRLEAPASTLKGLPSILGDHFSPVLALLAPVRWLGTDALLVAQAALVVAAALPIAAFTRRRLGEGATRAVVIAYLLFGGVQEALWFDLHEVAFAPLLIALCVDAADRRRFGRSVAAAAALLAVKEDMAFLVIAIGLWYALLGRRALGAAVAAGAAAWFVVVTELLIPWAAGGGAAYGYWDYRQFGDGPLDSLLGVLREPWRVVTVAVSPAEKLRTLAYLLGAFLGLALLSPLRWLLVPLLAARLLSDTPKHWTLEDHYSLTIAPVLALGAADGLARLARRWPRGERRAAVALVAVAVALVPAFPLRELARPAFYAPPPAYRAAGEALARVPDGAPVSASNRLVSHLSARDDIRLLGPGPPRPQDWVVAATGDASAAGVFPNRDAAALRALVDRARTGRQVVFERGGIVVLRPR